MYRHTVNKLSKLNSMSKRSELRKRIQDAAEKQHIVDETEKGHTLTAICKRLKLEVSAVAKEYVKDPDFRQRVYAAREFATHNQVESLLTIADDAKNLTDVHIARLKSDNIKWVAGKRMPNVYGDKFSLDVNHTIDIGPALLAAAGRAIKAEEISKTVLGIESKEVVEAEAVNEVVDAEVVNEVVDVSKVNKLEDLL